MDMDKSSIIMGLYQGSVLNLCLFTLVMDELTSHIQDDVLWCILFTDDIISVCETSEGVNKKKIIVIEKDS